jgi:hypothetical protein
LGLHSQSCMILLSLFFVGHGLRTPNEDFFIEIPNF